MSRSLHAPGHCNPSANPTFAEVLVTRRRFLSAGLGIATLGVLPGCAAQGRRPAIGFMPIAPSSEDLLRVPPEHAARVLYRWGDPVGAAAGMPEFRPDGSNSAADQALQAGMHHDGMHYFPLQGDVAATRFRWEVFAPAGPEGKNTIKGDAFACPDGLWIDSMGTLWLQTDVSPTALGREVTGFHTTPDNRSAFVNIQHPGETPGDRSDPGNPRAFSNWPDYAPNGRPRSATVVIRRKDGGVIGT